MNKRIQIILNAEASASLDKLHKEVMKDFRSGSIKLSDLVSEIIIQNKIDIKDIRLKYTDLKKSLMELANNENVDVDMVMKTLSELKGKYTKKQIKSQPVQLEGEL